MKHIYGKIKSKLSALKWNDRYITESPSDQNAVDLFRGEWPELLYLISKVSDNAIIWTQYYDKDELQKSGRNLGRIAKAESLEFNGFNYSAHRQHYGRSLLNGGFCGGPSIYSYWMPLEAIFAGLKYFGFKTIETNHHESMHLNGPAISLTCMKS